jgi:hypothetical protein
VARAAIAADSRLEPPLERRRAPLTLRWRTADRHKEHDGKLMLTMLGAIAAFERDLTAT